MKVTIYSTQYYETSYFQAISQGKHELQYREENLTLETVEKMNSSIAVSCFVTDQLDRPVLARLKEKGVKLIALRSAGFDHVDLWAAKELGLMVVRVPTYSPQAVAEFTLGLMLSVIRKISRAHDRIRQYNFSLEGLLGFNLQGKTVGIVGTGNIGSALAKILSGFGCTLLAYDPNPNKSCEKMGVTYVTLTELLQNAHVITLHCPLNEYTRHIINKNSIELMRADVVLINTGRGALIDTSTIISALKEGKIGGLGIDVYEHESKLFFQDHSDEIILDDQFIRLQSFPNVLITGHQAFFTQEAVLNIIKTTLENFDAFEQGIIQNQVSF